MRLQPPLASVREPRREPVEGWVTADETTDGSAAPSLLVTIVALAAIGGLTSFIYPFLFGWHSQDVDNFFVPWLSIIIEKGPTQSLAEPMKVVVDSVNGYANYSPPYLYLLILGSLASAVLEPFTIVKAVGVVGLLFCVACMYDLFRVFLTARRALLAAASILLLPTPALNGALWGQVDAFWAGLVILGIAAALREHWMAMMVALGAAVAFKAQAVMIGPFVLYIMISRRIPISLVVVPVLTYVVLMLPAWAAGRPAWELATIYLEQGNAYRWLAMNSPNPWAFIQYFDLLSYEVGVPIGLAVAGIGGFALAALAFRWRLAGSDLLLLALLSAVLMPYLLPKMLDRYFFLADLLAYTLAIVRLRWWTVGAAVGIQLGSLGAYASHFLELSFGKGIGAVLIGGVLVVVLLQLYRILNNSGKPLLAAPKQSSSQYV
jgi:Gpi18-like mannosyltransferase